MEGQEEPHPIQVDKLKNLRKLSSVRFDQWMKFDNLRQLTCLEKLKLEGKFGIHGVHLSNSISELHILKSLYLKVSAGSTIPPLVMNTWNGLSKLDIKGHMPELPEASQFPPILKKLTLEGTMLDHDPMPILEQLPELSTLRLRADSYIGHEMKVSKRRFAQLNVLQISGLTKLRKLKIKTPSMKRLKELEFYEESQIPKIRKLKKLVEVDIIGYTPLSSHIIREEIAFLQKGDWKYTSRTYKNDAKGFHFQREISEEGEEGEEEESEESEESEDSEKSEEGEQSERGEQGEHSEQGEEGTNPAFVCCFQFLFSNEEKSETS